MQSMCLLFSELLVFREISGTIYRSKNPITQVVSDGDLETYFSPSLSCSVLQLVTCVILHG
jgi:hypothetical protein